DSVIPGVRESAVLNRNHPAQVSFIRARHAVKTDIGLIDPATCAGIIDDAILEGEARDLRAAARSQHSLDSAATSVLDEEAGERHVVSTGQRDAMTARVLDCAAGAIHSGTTRAAVAGYGEASRGSAAVVPNDATRCTIRRDRLEGESAVRIDEVHRGGRSG